MLNRIMSPSTTSNKTAPPSSCPMVRIRVQTILAKNLTEKDILTIHLTNIVDQKQVNAAKTAKNNLLQNELNELFNSRMKETEFSSTLIALVLSCKP